MILLGQSITARTALRINNESIEIIIHTSVSYQLLNTSIQYSFIKHN